MERLLVEHLAEDPEVPERILESSIASAIGPVINWDHHLTTGFDEASGGFVNIRNSQAEQDWGASDGRWRLIVYAVFLRDADECGADEHVSVDEAIFVVDLIGRFGVERLGVEIECGVSG